MRKETDLIIIRKEKKKAGRGPGERRKAYVSRFSWPGERNG